MPRPTAEVYTAAAALVVALLKGGFLEEAEDFIEWYLETFDSDLSHLLPAELEADFDG
jgi:hypothetical protein